MEQFAQYIEDELNKFEDILHAYAAFYKSSKFVDEEEFGTFSQEVISKQVNAEYIAWAPLVNVENIEELPIAYNKLEQLYTVNHTRNESFLIDYIFPTQNYGHLKRLDVSVLPTVNELIKTSIELNSPMLLPVYDGNYSNSSEQIHLAMPIYKNNVENITIEQRQRNILGLIIVCFNVKQYALIANSNFDKLLRLLFGKEAKLCNSHPEKLLHLLLSSPLVFFVGSRV